VFCASPAYLKRHGTPKHPRDLCDHRLGLYSGYPTRDRWVFHAAAGEAVVLELKAALLSNSVHLLRDYGGEHACIVCIPTLVAAEPMLQGRLAPVLGDYGLSAFPLSAVYPRTQRSAFKLKLFIETLAAAFAGEPPWDRALIERGLVDERLIID
jgi:DNA-binding transcriptional LysR family regulator